MLCLCALLPLSPTVLSKSTLCEEAVLYLNAMSLPSRGHGIQGEQQCMIGATSKMSSYVLPVSQKTRHFQSDRAEHRGNPPCVPSASRSNPPPCLVEDGDLLGASAPIVPMLAPLRSTSVALAEVLVTRVDVSTHFASR